MIMQKFPLSMHPKRQFARANFVLLDGTFTYEVLPHFVKKEQLMNEINTPSSIGSAYGEKDVLPNKYLHMKRSFYIDEAFLLNDLIELHILGLDQIAKVYINDVLAIETSLPFYEQVVNVKKFLKIGDNVIYFIIKDDNLSSMYAKGYQDYERSKNTIPSLSGIINYLYLEGLNKVHLKNYEAKYDAKTRQLKFNFDIIGSFDRGSVEFYENGVCQHVEHFKDYSCSIDCKNLKEYSFDNPSVYDLVIKVDNDLVFSTITLLDVSVSIDDRHHPYLLFNGKKNNLHGFVDFGFDEISGLTRPIEKVKKMYRHLKQDGFNLVIFHNCIPSYALLDFLDHLGFVYIIGALSNGSDMKIYAKIYEKFASYPFLKDRSGRLGRNKGRNYEQFEKECIALIESFAVSNNNIAYNLYFKGEGQLYASGLTNRLDKIYPNFLFLSTFGAFDQMCGDIFCPNIKYINWKLRNDHSRVLFASFMNMSTKRLVKNAKKLKKISHEENISAFIYLPLMNLFDEKSFFDNNSYELNESYSEYVNVIHVLNEEEEK